MIEENLAVEIGLGEAIGARVELLAVARRLDPERVEPGVKMPAHAIGANQHQGAHRIARGLMEVGRREFRALGLRLGCDLGADGFFDFRPVAIERGGQFIARRQGPVVTRPGRSLGVLADVGRGILQAAEELLPFGIDGRGVVLVTGVDIVDVGGVGALQKRGKCKGGVRVLARHE